MFTILGVDGKEYGPVTTAQVKEWMHGGRANLQTPCRRADETAWKTIADFREFNFAGAATLAPTPETPAVEAAVVPAATPAAASSAPGVDFTGTPKDIAGALAARSVSLDVFGCLSRSFDLWKANFFPLVGVTLLSLLLQMLLGVIPILGGLAGIFLNGVFYGGLFYYYLGKMRGEPRELGDVFAGFARAFGPLAIASLLRTLLTVLIMLPFFVPLLTYAFEVIRNSHAPIPTFTPKMLLGFMVGLIPLLYFTVSWAFTFMLIIDKGLSPWNAMEVSRRVVTRQWFHVFAVAIFGGILGLLGLIGLIVGVLFTLPLMFGSLLYAYEDLCNPPPRG